MDWLEKILSDKNISQAQEYLLSETFLLQAGAILVALLIGKLLDSYFSSKIENLSQWKLRKWSIKPVIDAFKDVLLPLFSLTILFIIGIIFGEIEQKTKVIDVVLNLLAAWVVIKFVTSFIKMKVLSNWFAFIAWVIVALKILGLLGGVAAQLDAISISMGDTKLSVLLVIQAIFFIVIFIWVANALSKFLENQLMQSSLNPSLQVLFAKVIKIFLITLAFFVALNSLGIDLTALAVFSGALGVGLGFGLQKIVSNFISGIILLMDRSIKPGDVIAVDNTYGWVNKLSSRHVSVITRDGMEHLIPNELLITEKVENWSYSDSKIRIKVPFGVSYKSDMHKVKALVLESVKELSRVLVEPKPVCLMKGFGDSSVDFELRIWINDPQDGVRNIMSEVYFAIWDIFKANDIEIPFPQRDVHIKEALSFEEEDK